MNEAEPQSVSGITFSWPGKRLPGAIDPARVRLVETFAPLLPAREKAPDNSLFFGDNLPLLAMLHSAGQRFRLIYADPPYNSGVDWARKLRRRGPKSNTAAAVVARQVQYGDVWEGGAYLQFLYERLYLLRELLTDDGTLWLHCDHRHAHHIRCLLEEVFGPENFLNTITWRSQTARGAKVNAFYFPNSAHSIHVVARSRKTPPLWQPPKKRTVLTETEAARTFMRDERGFFRTSDPGDYTFASLCALHAEGRLYAPYGGEVVVDPAGQRVSCSNGGNLGVKYYLTALGDGRHLLERAVDNVWEDIPGLGTAPGEDLGYPTQKTEALLERIIETATRSGDWVLDPFCGSGTTLAVAQKLGRRWVGCDRNLGAIQTVTRRLQGVCTDEPTWTGFAVFTTDPPPARPPEAVCLPKMTLSITRIDGSATRIRVALAPAEALPVGVDWRSSVDSVVIDPDYDGQVLRVALADAPPKRAQLIAGVYEFEARSPATLAVRILEIGGGEQLLLGKI
ncbi:MAG: site-specific DNA-methyltransferase [Anaerolineales bacterium]|nr:site-specific DNA-methyltransferase [Anaerolineales bacterium]